MFVLKKSINNQNCEQLITNFFIGKKDENMSGASSGTTALLGKPHYAYSGAVCQYVKKK